MKLMGEEYGTALFELCLEEQVAHEVSTSLEAVKTVMAEYPQYIEILSCPAIRADERCLLIDEAFGDRVHEYALSFMKLMCERGHISYMSSAILRYQELYEASLEIMTAEVTSAVPLDKKQRDTLKSKLESRFSRSVKPIFHIDKSILGGVIVNIDGKVIDGSLKGQLARIGKSIGG